VDEIDVMSTRGNPVIPLMRRHWVLVLVGVCLWGAVTLWLGINGAVVSFAGYVYAILVADILGRDKPSTGHNGS
jgi:hypothetical protein